MPKYSFTQYFENTVLTKRSHLRKDWCIHVIENAARCEPQERNRHRFWARVEGLNGRYLRVITLEDKVAMHNAFIDRDFVP
jgi:hypothetical protein